MSLYFDYSGLVQPLVDLRLRTQEMAVAAAYNSDVITEEGTETILLISDAASENAPRLTGTLAAAHHAKWESGRGDAFVDPTAVNPVFGGKPAEYGVLVHGRKPWLQETVDKDAPEIMDDFIHRLMSRWDEVWE